MRRDPGRAARCGGISWDALPDATDPTGHAAHRRHHRQVPLHTWRRPASTALAALTIPPFHTAYGGTPTHPERPLPKSWDALYQWPARRVVRSRRHDAQPTFRG